MLSETFQRETIAQNFQLISAICFQGYLSDGKGILLLSQRPESVKCLYWLIPSYSTDTNLLGIYVGEYGQAFQTIFRGDWGKLSSVITEYNARELSLAVFHNRQEQKFFVFFLQDSEFSPVNSHRVLQPRLAEFFFQTISFDLSSFKFGTNPPE